MPLANVSARYFKKRPRCFSKKAFRFNAQWRNIEVRVPVKSRIIDQCKCQELPPFHKAPQKRTSRNYFWIHPSLFLDRVPVGGSAGSMGKFLWLFPMSQVLIGPHTLRAPASQAGAYREVLLALPILIFTTIRTFTSPVTGKCDSSFCVSLYSIWRKRRRPYVTV